MLRNLTMLVLAAWATSATALAADEAPVTATSESEITSGFLKNEIFGVKPQVGAMVFSDQNGDTSARGAIGATLEANLASTLNKDWGNNYFGIVTGLIYSHVGAPGATFVGTSQDSNNGSAGANVAMIPANLKIGRNLTDNMRLSVRGGGNVLYRSLASAVQTGPSSSASGAVWRIYPDVGVDFEWSLGKTVALMLRPDVTLTPGDAVFTGMASLAFPIG